MHTKILGCTDKRFKPYVSRAIDYYGKYLIPNKRLYKNLSLTVKFNSKMDVYGTTSIVEYNNSNDPRVFLIQIHPGIGAREILSTLAHEMVHVKQFVYNEMNEDLNKWKTKKIDYTLMDYYSLPWELEAHGYEVGMMSKFATAEKLWEVFEGINNLDAPIAYKPIAWKTCQDDFSVL